MKKKIFALTVIVCIITVVMAAFVACDGDKLFDSTWELTALQNAQGEIIACGEGFSYDTTKPRITVTCKISVGGEISLNYAEGSTTIKGQMTQTSTGADGSVRYSISFEDGRQGSAVYISKKDAVYLSDADSENNDIEEIYELTITIGEEYTLYFKRGANISQ